VRQRHEEPAVDVEHAPDRSREWLLADKSVDGHLADQQHDAWLEQSEFAIKERSAQLNLGARGWSIAVPGAIARKTASERRQ
jgi:hypothetical protein